MMAWIMVIGGMMGRGKCAAQNVAIATDMAGGWWRRVNVWIRGDSGAERRYDWHSGSNVNRNMTASRQGAGFIEGQRFPLVDVLIL